MAKNITEARGNTLFLTLGKETISGTKSASGRYENPEAGVEIFDKNLFVDIPKGITKVAFGFKSEYIESTTRKDVPNFSIVAKRNGKVLAEKVWSDPDRMNKFERLGGDLFAELDLKEFFSETEKVTLQFDIVLECWLEESSWLSEGKGKKTISAAGETSVQLRLPKAKAPKGDPEVNLEITPTHSPGTDSPNFINSDWGNPYSLTVRLTNNANTKIEVGEFTLIEDGKEIKDATLKKSLPPGRATHIISEDAATWILTKGPKDWEWYGPDEKDTSKFKVIKQKQVYQYYLTGKIIDENNFQWNVDTSGPLGIGTGVNVRVPDYKINALDLYNQVITVKAVADTISPVSSSATSAWGLAKIFTPEKLAETLVKLGINITKLASVLTIVLGIEITVGMLLISSEAYKILLQLKNNMDDPPKINLSYNHARNYKYSTYKIKPTKNKNLKKAQNIAVKLNLIKNYLSALNSDNNKLWSAKIYSDAKFIKFYLHRISTTKTKLVRTAAAVQRNFFNLAAYIKKVKLAKHISKRDRLLLKKLGLTNKQIRTVIESNKRIRQNKLKLYFAIRKLAYSLKKFSKSYGKLRTESHPRD